LGQKLVISTTQSICEGSVISLVTMETMSGFAGVEKLDILNFCCGEAQVVGCHNCASMVCAEVGQLEHSSSVIFPAPFFAALKGLMASGIFVAQNELLITFSGVHRKMQELFINLASHD